MVTPEEYTHYEATTDLCHILFAPSDTTEVVAFGVKVLEKYVVEFDIEGARIGFNPRVYTPA